MKKQNSPITKKEENKERLEFILESAKGGDWDLDLATGKAVTSFRHDQCFGATEPIPDWSYEKFISYVHPDDRDSESKKFQEAVASGNDWCIDCRVVWEDGSIHWIQSSGRNYRYLDGKPTRMLGMVREVTDQKLLELSLKESKNQIQNIFSSAPVAIAVITGPEHTYVMANDDYQKMVGRTLKQLIGKTSKAIFPELTGKGTFEIFDAIYESGESFSLAEYPVKLDKNNDSNVEQMYFRFSAVPLKNAEGKCDSIIIVSVDITEQVETRKKIEESHQKIRNLIEQAPVPMCLYRGVQFTIEIVNSKMLAIWGKDLETVINKPVFEGLPEAKGQGFEDLLQKVYTTGESFSANEITITLLRNGINEKIYVNLLYEPYRESDGTISGIMEIANDVTEQVLSRKKIEQSEKKFEAAILAVSGVIWTNNGLGEMEGEQSGWAKLTGQSFEEYQGYGWAKVVHPDDVQSTINAWNKAVKNKSTFEFEHRLKTKDGQWRNFSIRAIPLLNGDGSLHQWVGVHTDITEILKAQIVIQESEERFRTFGNNIQNLAWIAEGDGNIFWYNQRWLDYTGLTLDEMKGWGWQKVHHPDHVERILEIVKQLWVTDEPFELTFPLKRADGVYRWFLTRAVPVKNSDGKIYRWIGTNTDINDLVKAEEKLKQSEQRYDRLIQSSPSGIGILYGEDLIITVANDPIIEIWGKGKAIIGKKYFEALPELAEQGYKEVFSQVYKTGIPFNAIETPVSILQNGEVTLKYYNFILYPQRNANNEVDGIGIIATEVTSHALLNNKVKESEKRFTGMVEHAPVAIAVLKGENFVVEVANPKILELWGKPLAQMINRPVFEAMPDAAGQGFEELLTGVYITGKPFVADELPITLIRNGKAENLFVNFVYTPLYDTNNKIDGVLTVATENYRTSNVKKKKLKKANKNSGCLPIQCHNIYGHQIRMVI